MVPPVPVIRVMVYVVSTVCVLVAEAGLALKLLSPLYVAMRFFVPAVVLVNEQVVAGKVIVQVSVPSLTVIVPEGVPEPGAFAATVAPTVYATPTLVGSGVSLCIVAVVLALLTVCATPVEARLALKLASPGV